MKKNAYENVCRMAAILYRIQCVKSWDGVAMTTPGPWHIAKEDKNLN